MTGEFKVRLFGLVTSMTTLIAILVMASLPALRAARDRLPPAGPSDDQRLRSQGLRSHEVYETYALEPPPLPHPLTQATLRRYVDESRRRALLNQIRRTTDMLPALDDPVRDQ